MKIGIHLRRSERCITRQHVNAQHSQSNVTLSPNESLLLATINAVPPSPNSHTGPVVVDYDDDGQTQQQQHLKPTDDRRNSKESMINPTNLIRKMVRSCSNSSLLSSLSLKLNLQSSQLNSPQTGATPHNSQPNQINLHQLSSQTNSQTNLQTTATQQPLSTDGQSALESHQTKKANNSSIGSTKQSIVNSSQFESGGGSGGGISTTDNENTRNAVDEMASTRGGKLAGRLRNVIEEKDGEELAEEDAERLCMLVVKDEEAAIQNSISKDKCIGEQMQSTNDCIAPKDANVNNKRKQFQKMSPFSTLDSSSSNGWTKSAGLSYHRANTALHSQDSSASLNVRRKNWRFFKNRHSTRTIHHSSSSRRAVVKMLGK